MRHNSHCISRRQSTGPPPTSVTATLCVLSLSTLHPSLHLGKVVTLAWPGLKGPSSSTGNECWDTKHYGFSVVMRNEYCHYIQHLLLIFTKSRQMYTHARSIITYTYVHFMYFKCNWWYQHLVRYAVEWLDYCELQSVWKDEVVVQFRARSLNSPRGTEENHKISRSR